MWATTRTLVLSGEMRPDCGPACNGLTMSLKVATCWPPTAALTSAMEATTRWTEAATALSSSVPELLEMTR